ncbi:TetR/AcrR family transcriptional regulator [Nocardioides sp. AE5]|uniref:TetR/AcrR family transcriptional regulator n=1 Tax=Nocardioides sp. AE5 TaxID=2962573 RepID=UPI002881753F|nr:TetR/AcrR family transcriptional regulator [Nocardioides sp. AE5]MDT0202370.1 TetR/AcrR family transcriptional regulator [Nocardioides sp. AE5]
MTEVQHSDTRTRLIDAAADLVAAAPGEDFSLRAVCDAVGVKMPTLYHFFGNKQGLVDAVVEHGFEMYVATKTVTEPTGDPIQDLRTGWDAHVAFGLENPGFYTLMYGTVRPGHSPAAQSRPSQMLHDLTRRAQEQGRLVVPAEQAAAHVLATNVGVTLHQIIASVEDRPLSIAVREGVIAAVTGTSPRAGTDGDLGHDLVEQAAAHPGLLGAAETRLLIEWVRRLREATQPGK